MGTDSQFRRDTKLVQGGRMIITMMAQIVPTYFDVWRFFYSPCVNIFKNDSFFKNQSSRRIFGLRKSLTTHFNPDSWEIRLRKRLRPKRFLKHCKEYLFRGYSFWLILYSVYAPKTISKYFLFPQASIQLYNACYII